jgi:sugar phosphate isomerase/epimerase
MNKSRRNFLTKSAALGGIIVSPFENLLVTPLSFTVPADFKIVIMATKWGYEGDWDSFCKKVKDLGYDGIEVWWPADETNQRDMFAALKKYQLSIGFLAGGSDKNPDTHFNQFKAMINGAAYQKELRPLYINCHSGRDYFSMEQNKPFIDHTTALHKETGILICHETHRSRILFAAHIARQYVERFADLRLTVDISHWCNVHESLLLDQEETVQLALSRAGHIHARIGHPEGPQVNDPRAPEWETTVNRHLEWWDKIIQNRIAAGDKQITILTEFGPPDYMPTLPYTRQALANQWDINVHMKNLLRKRYAK